MLQRLRNHPIWRSKILNGDFLFCEKNIAGRWRREPTMQRFLLHCLQQKHRLMIQLRSFWCFGVGENQLPSKIVVGTKNIYHVGNVTIFPLHISAPSLLCFPPVQIFLILRQRALLLWIWHFPGITRLSWRHFGLPVPVYHAQYITVPSAAQTSDIYSKPALSVLSISLIEYSWWL